MGKVQCGCTHEDSLGFHKSSFEIPGIKLGCEDAGFSSQISTAVCPHDINIPIFKVSEFSKLASWVNSKLTRRWPTMNHNNSRFRNIFKFHEESAMKINRIISLKGKGWNKKSSDNSMNVADVDKKNVFVSKNECYLLNSHRSLFKMIFFAWKARE